MRWFIGSFLAAAIGSELAAAQGRPADTVRFVVLGHIRGKAGELSPKLDELIAKIRPIRPAFAVLTGDIIWGDVHKRLAERASIEREWDAVDSALATLAIPLYRVPGNHDISDVPSRDVWYRRYGPLPNRAVVGDLRLLLLSSAWLPADGDTLHNPYIRGVDLDSAQVAWLARELAAPERYGHTFVFMHHLLWWEPPEGRWWREVHPLLAGGRVAAVFSGDYGPLKFSTMERDQVRYYQSSIEVPVDLTMLQDRVTSRILSAQFDNFFEVVVSKAGAEVRVHTLAEVSSGEFTPDRHRAVNTPRPGPTEPIWRRIWQRIGTPPRLAALALGVAALFLAGVWTGRRSRRGA
ncbi:MAG: metallophosphoesterase family protein [Gemmatimonadales bacterium]